mgnify:CR=1 FL=1
MKILIKYFLKIKKVYKNKILINKLKQKLIKTTIFNFNLNYSKIKIKQILIKKGCINKKFLKKKLKLIKPTTSL